MACEWNLQNPVKIVLEDGIIVFRVSAVGIELATKILREKDYWSSALKKS